MALHERYVRARAGMLANPKICSENRELFNQFLDYEEYKLKRKNHIGSIDSNSCKTLLAYISRLQTVNRWFSGSIRAIKSENFVASKRKTFCILDSIFGLSRGIGSLISLY